MATTKPLISRILFILILFLSIQPLMAQVQSRVYHFNDIKAEKKKKQPMLQGRTTDFEHLEIDILTLQPGKASRPGYNNKYLEELVIVKEGELKVTLNNQTKILGPGSIVLVIPGDWISVENGGIAPLIYFSLKYKSVSSINIERGKKAGGSFMIDWNDIAVKEHERGSRRDFFERPTSMVERFEMHVTTLNGGLSSHDPHTHRAEEIVLIIKGNVSMQIGEQHEAASSGDLVFLGSQVPHALTNTGNEACQYFAFQW